MYIYIIILPNIWNELGGGVGERLWTKAICGVFSDAQKKLMKSRKSKSHSMYIEKIIYFNILLSNE